jgi:hypothetical protein
MNWQETAEVGEPKRNGKYVVYHDGMKQMFERRAKKWYNDRQQHVKGTIKYWAEVTDGPWVPSYSKDLVRP